jgi:hypothetical protein
VVETGRMRFEAVGFFRGAEAGPSATRPKVARWMERIHRCHGTATCFVDGGSGDLLCAQCMRRATRQ